MPEAVLLSDVERLGTKGEVVDVSKGYLRNFLIPRKLATPATKGAIAAAAAASTAQQQAAADAVAAAREQAELLDKTVLTIAEKAGEDGRLFGSVTTQDIADAIKAARGITVDRRHIELEDAIKAVGTYQVTVEIASGIKASVKTMVVELR